MQSLLEQVRTSCQVGKFILPPTCYWLTLRTYIVIHLFCDLISSQSKSNNIQCYKISCLCGGSGHRTALPEPFPTTSLPPLPAPPSGNKQSKVPFPLFDSHSFSHSRNEATNKILLLRIPVRLANRLRG